MSRKIESLAASSVDSLLTKIRNLASRPIPEFNKFEALELLEALKNAAQDVKHEKTGYLTIILRGRAGYRMIDNQRGA